MAGMFGRDLAAQQSHNHRESLGNGNRKKINLIHAKSDLPVIFFEFWATLEFDGICTVEGASSKGTENTFYSVD